MPTILRRFFYAGSCLFEIARGVILTAVAVVLIHLLIATIFIVDGISMEPNFHTGELILVNRAGYLFGKPQRGDVVILRFPGDPEHKKYVKRLIGLPGDTIELINGDVLINGVRIDEPYLPAGRKTYATIPGKERWVLGPDEYWLLGDNRPNSNDSRTWDAANKRFLIGKAIFVFWPPAAAGIVPAESYQLPKT